MGDSQVQRPWGGFESLAHGEGFQVKKLLVTPGGRLSLQRHAQRAEHWIVASGVATVTIGEERREMQPGEHASIPRTAVHRLENLGQCPLVLIEVQLGAYLGEDDIERLSDVYGRADRHAVSRD